MPNEIISTTYSYNKQIGINHFDIVTTLAYHLTWSIINIFRSIIPKKQIEFNKFLKVLLTTLQLFDS